MQRGKATTNMITALSLGESFVICLSSFAMTRDEGSMTNDQRAIFSVAASDRLVNNFRQMADATILILAFWARLKSPLAG
jgi:hypothetical protein